MKRETLFSVLRTTVSISLIGALLYAMRGSYRDFVEILKHVNGWLFILSLAGFIAGILISAIRLKWILAAQEINVTINDVISLTLIGYFFNNFLPTSMGGDVVKAYYVSHRKSDRLGSFTSVFVDRFIGLLTMVIMASLALLVAGNIIIDRRITAIIYALTAAGILASVFLINKNFARRFSFLLKFIKPLETKVLSFYDVVNKYRHHKWLIGKTLLISFVGQGIYFMSIGVLALGIGTPVSLEQIFLRMPIVCALGLVPSIGGLGVREGSIVVFFTPLVGKEAAFALSILGLIMLVVVSIIGGLVYAFSPQFRVNRKVLARDT